MSVAIGREQVTDDGRLLIDRLRLLSSRWFGMYLHRIVASDLDRQPHNHGWSFVSLVLRGGYSERVDGVDRHHRAGSLHRMTPEQYHRIEKLDRLPTWTLVLRGRRRVAWGFTG